MSKNKYSYCLWGRDDTVVLLIKTPTFVHTTELCTVAPEKEGVVATFILTYNIKVYVLRYASCWSFALGQSSSDFTIPCNWIIDIRQSYQSSCSTYLRILTNQAVAFKRFTEE